MGVIKSHIEDSDGKIIENPSEDQILGVLKRFGKGIEHCNFEYGDDFVSAYGDASSGLYLYYSDAEGKQHTSSEALTPEEVCKIFMSARDGNKSWQSEISFTEQEWTEGPTIVADGPVNNGSQTSAASGKPKSLKEQLLDTVKSEAARSLNRTVRNGIRGLFGKKF